MARPATMEMRVVISVSDTQTQKLIHTDVVAPSARAQMWAIPLVTLSFLIVTVVLVSMVWPMSRYETAPGRADLVAPRLSISGTDREVYEPTQSVRFVTALGSELRPLQAFMGWIDPVVNVLTCEQRFGDCDPDQSREVQLGAMATAKEIASFVALKYLGIETSLVDGPAQVAGFDASLCPTDAPALRACKVLAVGDTITSVDVGDGPVVIDVVSKLSEVLKGSKPGDVVSLTVQPIGSTDDADERTVQVELIASPDDAKRTLIGFNSRDTRTVDLPFSIDIDTDRIGGPSAGLAFTLALIDELSPGDLVPSAGAAVTGTIAEDGTVGAIGALVQKANAVKKSGARFFLVPTAQGKADIAAAQASVGDSLELVPVATLDEAIAALVERGGTAPQPTS